MNSLMTMVSLKILARITWLKTQFPQIAQLSSSVKTVKDQLHLQVILVRKTVGLLKIIPTGKLVNSVVLEELTR